jgi:hypothetical protein
MILHTSTPSGLPIQTYGLLPAQHLDIVVRAILETKQYNLKVPIMKTSILRYSRPLLRRLALCGLLSASAAQLQATSYTWTGSGAATDASWNNTANWSGGTVPGNPQTFTKGGADGAITFSSNPANLNSVVPTPWTIGRLVFNTGSGNFVLSGSDLVLAQYQTGGNNGTIDGTALATTTISISNNIYLATNSIPGSGSNRQQLYVSLYTLNLYGSLNVTNSDPPQLTFRGSSTGKINLYGPFVFPMTLLSPATESPSLTDGITVTLNNTSNVFPFFIVKYGILRLGANNAITNAATLGFNQATASQPSTFDMNNFNLTLAAVTNGVSLSGVAQKILTGTGSGGTLTVQDDGLTYSWLANGLAISGNGAFVKNGNGNMTILSSGNSVSTFTINNGSVTLGGGSINGTNLNVNSPGTLLASGGTLGSSVLSVNNGGVFTASGGAVITSPLINVANGSTFDVSGIGGLSLASQSLAGNGTVTGSVSASGASKLYPGGVGAVGSLTLASDLTINSTTAMQIDLKDTPTPLSDTLVLNGGLYLNANLVLSLNFIRPTIPEGVYTLLTYNFLAGGGTIQFDLAYPNITLNVGATSTTMTVGPGGASSLITITPNGTNFVLYTGANATLAVTASGAPPLFYQWNLNGTPRSGATTSAYALNNVQAGNSGSYTCTVTNSLRSATSDVMTVTVLTPIAPYPLAVLADQALAYWRLDEPDDGMGNNGVKANDYAGGFSGVYSNVSLSQPGYNPSADPDAAALFSGGVNSYAGNIQGISFATPTNSSVALSVEAWVNGPSQFINSSIITKGYGSGGEQFNLDCGGGSSHTFRFFVRDAGGQTHSAVSPKGPDGAWHHLVGVCDEFNSKVVIYVDGLLSATGTASPSNGLLSSSNPVTIGSKQTSASSDYENTFNGTIDEPAIYGYALSSTQVLAHYFAALPPPGITMQPTNATAAEGTTAVFYSQAYGPAPLGYQWYDVTSGTPVLLTDQTNSTLVLPNVSGSANGSQFQVVATDPYGTATSAMATLTVISGPPYYLVDLSSEGLVLSGGTATLSVTIGGTAPFTYRWQKNGVDLSDNAQITGSHSNVLTVASAQPGNSGTYQVFVSNNVGGPVPSAQEALTVQGALTFNNDGLGWSLNNGATLGNNALTLTDGAGSESRCGFFRYPLYIGAFEASFIYQDVGGGGANGMAFVVQNSSQGAAALGGPSSYGGGLGYLGISPSVAIQLNIYSAAPGGLGYAYGQNGLNAGPYSLTDPVNLASGNPINVYILYANGNLQLQLSDLVSNTTFSASVDVGSLPTLLGSDTAYIGLTGGDGGIPSTQVVSNFTFVSLTALSLQRTPTNTIVFSWPASALGYALEQNSDLATANWVSTPNPVTVVNGQNQVLVAPSTGNLFYRLRLQ